MAYTFKYRVNFAPEASKDGSGCIMHDVEALAASDGVTYSPVPGRHMTICVPYAQINSALGSGTTNQKVTKYKEALAANLFTQPTPVQGWSTADLNTLMANNDAASASLLTALNFITVTLGQQFPITFSF